MKPFGGVESGRRSQVGAAGRSETAVRPIASRPLAILLWSLMAGCLTLITVAAPGATRMYAWPWSIAYWMALVAPASLIILRAFDRSNILVLPSRGWTMLAIGSASTLVAAALSSPYRHSSIIWAAAPLGSIAVFFAVYDWLHREPDATAQRRAYLHRVVIWIFAVVVVAGLAEWAGRVREVGLVHLWALRNPYPLGHSNYTAGLALMMLPLFAFGAFRERRATRVIAGTGLVLAVAMLLTSGSRGGAIGLVAMVAAAIALSALSSRWKWRISLIAALAAIAFIAANPRTRALLTITDPNSPPNISNVQRSAMAIAGLRMGLDRPVFGWGPGTTPLAFPRYRAALAGGAENVLQLHSVPVHLWAELGGAGVMCLLAGVWLVVRDARRDPAAAVVLIGYTVFGLFDFQLFVPAFGFGLAVLTAQLAARAPPRSRTILPHAIGLFAIVVVAAILFVGRRDRTPELNAEALSDEVGIAQPQRAIALLRESLALNPDQEIAHFNLGWLLIVRDPAAAASSFVRAAHLVPDKGGVYFGLGLARLNSNDAEDAARALALEALNDPVFQLSPWWEDEPVARLHARTLALLANDLDRVIAALPDKSWSAGEAQYLRAFTAWLAGTGDAKSVATVANTPQRRAYFEGSPNVQALRATGIRTLRNERLGYPVLMRAPDIAPPLDLWVIRESAVRQSALAYLWPDKGWLPAPLLIALLDGKDLPKN